MVHAREIVVQSGAALRVERALCRHFATRVIAVSYAVAAQLDPANVVVLDEYLDPQEFSPAHAGAFRNRVAIPDDVPLIGAVARLDPLKGLDTLLDAYAIARAARPDAQLVIVGSPVLGQDAYAARLRARLADTPGAQLLESRDDIPDVMADLDVLAFPSIEPESYGLVLVEALASGAPAVATDHGGPPEIVARATAGTALVVPPGDAGALAEGVARPAARADVSRTPPGPPARVHAARAALRRAVRAGRRLEVATTAPRSQPAPLARVYTSRALWYVGESAERRARTESLARCSSELRNQVVRPRRRRYSAKYARSSASVRARPLSAYFVTHGVKPG